MTEMMTRLFAAIDTEHESKGRARATINPVQADAVNWTLEVYVVCPECEIDCDNVFAEDLWIFVRPSTYVCEDQRDQVGKLDPALVTTTMVTAKAKAERQAAKMWDRLDHAAHYTVSIYPAIFSNGDSAGDVYAAKGIGTRVCPPPLPPTVAAEVEELSKLVGEDGSYNGPRIFEYLRKGLPKRGKPKGDAVELSNIMAILIQAENLEDLAHSMLQDRLARLQGMKLHPHRGWYQEAPQRGALSEGSPRWGR